MQSGENWENGSLVPYGNIELSPAAVILNYGQGVFEGTKAFQTKEGKVALFRIDKNASRIACPLKGFVCLKWIKTFL